MDLGPGAPRAIRDRPRACPAGETKSETVARAVVEEPAAAARKSTTLRPVSASMLSAPFPWVATFCPGRVFARELSVLDDGCLIS
jgi:hypothetical protein